MIGVWFIVHEYYSVEDSEQWIFTATDLSLVLLHPLTFSAFQSEMQSFCHTIATDVDVRSVWLMNIQGSK